jgi:hypothetical protein
MTACAVLLVLTALRPRVGARIPLVWVPDIGPATEHLVYIVAPAAAHTSAVRSAAHPPSPNEAGHATASPARDRVSLLSRDDLASVSAATGPPAIAPDTASYGTPPAVSPLRRPDTTAVTDTTAAAANVLRTTVGAPAVGVGSVLALGRLGPFRFDSALRAVRDSLAAGPSIDWTTPLPLTQAERDSQLRAEALANIVARAVGRPAPRTTLAGGSIAAPLPFGGPSRKQWERDRAIHAQTLEILARVRQRADSVAAARRRQRADSLAQLQDSLRHIPLPQP